MGGEQDVAIDAQKPEKLPDRIGERSRQIGTTHDSG